MTRSAGSWCALFAGGWILAAGAGADTLALRDGTVVTGKVTRISDQLIEVRSGKKASFYGVKDVMPAPAGEASATVRAPERAPAAKRSFPEQPADKLDALRRAMATGSVASVQALLRATPGLARGDATFVPLLEALQPPRGTRAAEDRVTLVKALLAGGADPNAPGYLGRTPLHMAWDPECLGLLLARGGQVEISDDLGATPLHFAAGYATNPACVRMLLGKGANPNAVDDDRRTPLHAAAVGVGGRETVEALLAAGADPRLRDANGKTAFDLAILHDPSDKRGLVAVLGAKAGAAPASKQGEPSPLHGAAASNNRAAVELLLGQGADVNAKDKAGRTPLFFALGHGLQSNSVVYLLLEHGADVTVVDAAGMTPLHAAANSISHEHVALLVERGAPLDAQDRLGETALFTSARQGKAAIVKALLKAGANPALPNREGLTPMHVAAFLGACNRIVPMLAAAGADVNARDGKGRTPLHYAAEKNDADCVAALLDAHADTDVRDVRGKTPADLARELKKDAVVDVLESPRRNR